MKKRMVNIYYIEGIIDLEVLKKIIFFDKV